MTDNETARKAKEEAEYHIKKMFPHLLPSFEKRVRESFEIAQKPLIERIAQLEKENKELKDVFRVMRIDFHKMADSGGDIGLPDILDYLDEIDALRGEEDD